MSPTPQCLQYYSNTSQHTLTRQKLCTSEGTNSHGQDFTFIGHQRQCTDRTTNHVWKSRSRLARPHLFGSRIQPLYCCCTADSEGESTLTASSGKMAARSPLSPLINVTTMGGCDNTDECDCHFYTPK